MSEYLSLDPQQLSTSSIHNYLLAAVAPRPIALASTISNDGSINLSPFSFFNVFSSNPPIMIFSPARRSRDNSTKDTYKNLKDVKEVVINIVNYPIVEQMSLSSTEYPKGVNEFDKAGFTSIKSDLIEPPRVAESPVSFECVVDKIIELGNQGGAGNLILSRVVKIHLDRRYLDQRDQLNVSKLDLVGRMGGSWYTRTHAEALFEIPKPLRSMGIGIDALPEHIIKSDVLTGNDLARLGNIDKLPAIKELNNKTLSNLSKTRELHRLAQRMIRKGNTKEALQLLVNQG